MIDAQTLVSLACLIMGQGSDSETSQIEATLTAAETRQLQDLLDSGPTICLPENLEEVIRNTKQKLAQGDIPDLSSGGAPSEGCLVGEPD